VSFKGSVKEMELILSGLTALAHGEQNRRSS